MPSFSRSVLKRPLCFILGSSSLTLAPFLLAMTLWPEGLNANAANFFWPATGFNLALVYLWGYRFAPLILLNALAAILLVGQPVAVSLAGAGLNMLEALLGSWMLRRFASRFHTGFPLHSLGVLCATSLLMGLLTAIPFSAMLAATGRVPPALFGSTVASNTAANACAVLLICPAVLACAERKTSAPLFTPIFRIGLLILATVCLAVFHEVFQAHFKYSFVMFPVMIFFAARYSFSQICCFLLVLMAMIYLSLILNAQNLPITDTPEILWFIQAFSWVLAATTLGMSALISENRRHALRSLQQENELLEAQLRGNRAELQALRYQINPHFLHNSLNSICAVVEEDSTKARTMITRLSSFLRATLDSPAGDRIPLETAFNKVMLYLDIEKIRYEDSLRIDVELDPALRTQPIPVFLLQPLVENAIQHGFMQSKGPFLLRIRARRNGPESFLVEVEHPGVWRNPPVGHHEGVGLENIKKRLRLIYGDNARLETELSASQVCQRLHFPLEAS